MRINSTTIIFHLLILPSIVLSQEFSRLEWPFISNYSKQKYNAENQNWSAGQDSKGNMYFGNNAGLLKFNGQSWNIYPLPNHGIIRSLAIDSTDRIFIGSYEEFGYWKEDEYGNYNYTSLKNLLDDYSFHNEEIWKILILDNKVYFQAFSKIFVYDGLNIRIINPSGIISSFSKVNNRLLVQITSKGLFELLDNTLKLIDNSETFTNVSIREVLNYESSIYLISTYENGIYRYDTKTKKIEIWSPDYQAKLSEKKINRAIISKDGKFVFGTILNGIYIFNSDGTYIQNVNQSNGLQNNTVLCLFSDTGNHLWIGLDNGIDNVSLESNISFYRDNQTNIGSVYTTIIHDNLLYVGTNRGLYVSHMNIKEQTGILKLKFQMIENSQDQVWTLSSYDNELFCGHNKGTFRVNGFKLEQVSNVSGGLSIVKFTKNDTEFLLQSTYTNLIIYRKHNNKWIFSHTIENFQHPIKYVEIDHLGNIWAGHFLKGLYKLRLNDDMTKIINETFIKSNNGFESDHNTKVIKFKNRVLFFNDGKIYTYDDLNEEIIKYNPITNNPNIKIKKLILYGNDYCWVVKGSDISYYHLTDSLSELLEVYPFELFKGELIENNEYILPINEKQAIICLNEGIALLNMYQQNHISPEHTVQINKVTSTGHKLIPLEIEQKSEIVPVLPYNQNSISFDFSYPQYNSRITFKIRLIGLDTVWTETNLNHISYERLPYNSYTFEIFAFNELNQTSDLQPFAFVIKPPFYLSFPAYLFYISLFAGLLFYISRYYRRRLKSQEIHLREENEKTLIKMRNEQLQSEIQQKTEQLADTTFAIIKKNELLMQLKKLLISNRKFERPSEKQINDSLRLIDRNIAHGEDWKIFENNFEQAHREFLSKLKNEFPDLSPNDLKLCAFLRMNLSSKKIGSLLGISTRSVENHRYRIRKKLHLGHEDNLTDFIMSF